MKIWEPMNCCICVSRRTGTLILGYLSLIASLAALGWFITLSISLAYSCQYPRCFQGGLIPVYCLVISLVVLHAVLSVLLVVGTHKKKTELMIPYLVIHAVLLVLNIIRTVIALIILAVNAIHDIGFILLCILFSVIVLSLQYYFLCVIYAHYKELKGMFDHKHLVESPEYDEKPVESKEPLPEAEEIKVPYPQPVDCKPPPYEP